MRYPLRHGATCWSLRASALLNQRRGLGAVPYAPLAGCAAGTVPAGPAATRHGPQASVCPPPGRRFSPRSERPQTAGPAGRPEGSRSQVSGSYEPPHPAAQDESPRASSASPFLPERPAYRVPRPGDAGSRPAVAPMSRPSNARHLRRTFDRRIRAAAPRGSSARVPGCPLAARGPNPRPERGHGDVCVRACECLFARGLLKRGLGCISLPTDPQPNFGGIRALVD